MKLECNINGQTQIYGIFGYPVKHSKSPTFQTYSFQTLGINAVYIPFEIKPEDLEKAVQSIKILGIKGINVTVPHKEQIIKYVDELSPEVKYIKATNTIHNLEGYLKAYNTDVVGFIRGLKEIEPNFSNKRFLVIGAGGASRAVLYGLVKEGVQKIIIANRTTSKIQNIIKDFSTLHRYIDQIITAITLEDIDKQLKNADIIINTTSIGLKEEDPELFNYKLIEPRHTVIDIIYRKTKLLKTAEEKGCKWQDGLPMLMYQGIESFKIWTGKEPPIDKIKNILTHG
ncbi:MAG: shikimate dehydrogenase [Aquificae bacterium]|nr:shikimate dehydrogenase [Aquificota bacterium]